MLEYKDWARLVSQYYKNIKERIHKQKNLFNEVHRKSVIINQLLYLGRLKNFSRVAQFISILAAVLPHWVWFVIKAACGICLQANASGGAIYSTAYFHWHMDPDTGWNQTAKTLTGGAGWVQAMLGSQGTVWDEDRSRTSEANQGWHSSGMAGQGHMYGNGICGWTGKGGAVAEVHPPALM